MQKILSKIGLGCYLVAALLCFTSCNDKLEIQQAYPFTIETMPVPKKLKVGETAEIRCQLKRDGRYLPTTYKIRFFQPDGKGVLKMDNGTVPAKRLLPAGERDVPALLHLCIHRPADH